jgi:2-polyprenyl-3-methyl-5-hydroxy-6-metoxy-1,4-benzoquinol methylase
VAVEVGRSEAARVGAEVGFEERDVIADGVPENYDVVMSTLFLHHLGEEEAWGLLRSMWGSGAGLVVVDDLERGWWGWVLAWLGSRVLSRSPVVHGDALKSVEGAWTGIEAVGLARSAGWLEVELRRHWPARYLMVGRPR